MRDKDQTKQNILQAVGKLLANGDGSLGINTIAREAGVDKVLIYRYFGGLPELLRAFAASGEFWPGFEDIMETSPYVAAMMTPTEIGARFVHGFIRELRSRPLTLEILRHEGGSQNELTSELTQVREASTRELAECYADRGQNTVTLHALVTAGIIHLLLQAKHAEKFCGVDIRSDEGWQRIERAAIAVFERTGEK